MRAGDATGGVAPLDGIEPAGFLGGFVQRIRKRRHCRTARSGIRRKPQMVALGDVFLIVENRRPKGRVHLADGFRRNSKMIGQILQTGVAFQGYGM